MNKNKLLAFALAALLSIFQGVFCDLSDSQVKRVATALQSMERNDKGLPTGGYNHEGLKLDLSDDTGYIDGKNIYLMPGTRVGDYWFSEDKDFTLPDYSVRYWTWFEAAKFVAPLAIVPLAGLAVAGGIFLKYYFK